MVIRYSFGTPADDGYASTGSVVCRKPLGCVALLKKDSCWRISSRLCDPIVSKPIQYANGSLQQQLGRWSLACGTTPEILGVNGGVSQGSDNDCDQTQRDNDRATLHRPWHPCKQRDCLHARWRLHQLFRVGWRGRSKVRRNWPGATWKAVLHRRNSLAAGIRSPAHWWMRRTTVAP